MRVQRLPSLVIGGRFAHQGEQGRAVLIVCEFVRQFGQAPFGETERLLETFIRGDRRGLLRVQAVRDLPYRRPPGMASPDRGELAHRAVAWRARIGGERLELVEQASSMSASLREPG